MITVKIPVRRYVMIIKLMTIFGIRLIGIQYTDIFFQYFYGKSGCAGFIENKKEAAAKYYNPFPLT